MMEPAVAQRKAAAKVFNLHRHPERDAELGSGGAARCTAAEAGQGPEKIRHSKARSAAVRCF
jgi:hypothetical protein